MGSDVRPEDVAKFISDNLAGGHCGVLIDNPPNNPSAVAITIIMDGLAPRVMTEMLHALLKELSEKQKRIIVPDDKLIVP